MEALPFLFQFPSSCIFCFKSLQCCIHFSLMPFLFQSPSSCLFCFKSLQYCIHFSLHLNRNMVAQSDIINMVAQSDIMAKDSGKVIFHLCWDPRPIQHCNDYKLLCLVLNLVCNASKQGLSYVIICLCLCLLRSSF